MDYTPGTVQVVEQHRRQPDSRCASQHSTIHMTGSAPRPSSQGTPPRARSSPGCLRRSRHGRSAQPSQHGRDAAQHAGSGHAVSRLGGAGQVQRQPALQTGVAIRGAFVPQRALAFWTKVTAFRLRSVCYGQPAGRDHVCSRLHSTPGAETSTLPTRRSATGRSTLFWCRASCPTSRTTGINPISLAS